MSRTIDDLIREHLGPGVEIITIDPGNVVLCDDCNQDYTDSDAGGGMTFQSKALGECCAPKWREDAIKYDEEHFIRENTTGKSFADWVREDLR